ncbi:hypothetical protein [uncultured Cohaesibacter sp.]|uniref:hypothetical protein n=1 Tax=uncultured Cohaesibacter sp. TaxID=1002546 RepID=UPI002AA88677|nr:hypothetical protein [uncultured Cohaesibacter sp.]
MLIKVKPDQRSTKSNWQDNLSWGDVVMFRFPSEEGGQTRPPKARPCVVHDVRDIAGVRLVTLIRGSKTSSQSEDGYETLVMHPIATATAGLSGPTRFDRRKRITVSVDHDWFVCGPAKTPVLGSLTGKTRCRFNSVRAGVDALIDLAVSRRAQETRQQSSPMY